MFEVSFSLLPHYLGAEFLHKAQCLPPPYPQETRLAWLGVAMS